MTIATISRQYGSNGDGVAQKTAQLLRVEVCDKESIERSLRSLGIEKQEVLRFDEKRPPIWSSFSVDKDRYAQFLRLAILDQARSGTVVFVGRGAPVILRDIPAVLNVRIIAPFETRVRRALAEFSGREDHARRLVKQHDHDRAGFYRYFFDADWDDAGLYDITLNTARIDSSVAAEMVVDALAMKQSEQADVASLELLEDRYLAALVAARIRFTSELSLPFLDVHAHSGTVTLAGTVSNQGLIDRCVSIAQAVPGVQQVVSDLQVIPHYIGTV